MFLTYNFCKNLYEEYLFLLYKKIYPSNHTSAVTICQDSGG